MREHRAPPAPSKAVLADLGPCISPCGVSPGRAVTSFMSYFTRPCCRRWRFASFATPFAVAGIPTTGASPAQCVRAASHGSAGLLQRPIWHVRALHVFRA